VAEVPHFVVDASVAVKWHLEDEPNVPEALTVLDDYQNGQINLLAPEQIRYEVPAAIRTAVLRSRKSPAEGREQVDAFLSLPLRTVRSSSLILRAYDLSLAFNCSLYDGLYVALAEVSRCPLIFADAALRAKLLSRFQWALWIEDYGTSG
jgi:predicted nucleic acid-binding protein